DLAGLAVAAERGRPGGAVYGRWRAASDAQAKALAGLQPGDRLPWVAGDLSALTLATTRLSELWVHTGDVAAGLARTLPPSGRLRPIARLAWRTLPYAFQRAGKSLAGPVALKLTAPDGSPWEFTPEDPAATVVTGPAHDFCLVAARRRAPADTALVATGPDADLVLELVRTFA
ncbi:MAG TPA: maleylpyruvate isomerase family mycothiol-dependent enzyme, partial [Acidimicrobiia bacterium]|nr:maleylpyruvate isomerase family mycothiol-dependent enzyme [Acidimicrobiia bacterium]